MKEGTNNSSDPSRRDVVKVGAATAVAAAVTARFGRVRAARAADDEIRVGLVGCGGRGSGAAAQAVQAAPNVKLVAVGDAFEDRLLSALKTFEGQEKVKAQMDVPAERRFVGLDAFEKVLKTDCNYVILASPPGFRVAHLRAALDAGKHIFTEKPMAVDAPGVRACFDVAEQAKAKNLALGVGLQRHHHRGYLEWMKRIHGGAIGKITSGRCFWMQGGLWMKAREKGWSDLEWQMRNWLYFTWLSGDHIVEQHIHNIDVVSWAIGAHPVAAVGMGGRQQRVDPAYGHIYDHFAIDFEYPDDVHVMSMSRQQRNCANAVSEHLAGTKGTANADNRKFDIKVGKKEWKFDQEVTDPYLQEHTDLIASIRKGKPLNELKAATESNLAAIMGRMAAYTGKRITWEQALASKESLVPEAPSFKAPMEIPPVAIPGKDLI